VTLARIAWLVTVSIALVTGALLVWKEYDGYGALAFVVAASAAINLR